MARKSAEKRERLEKTRRLINRERKSVYRTAVKKFEAAVAAGDKAQAETALAEANKQLDAAAGKGAIHKNTAARKKSRMAHAFSKLA